PSRKLENKLLCEPYSPWVEVYLWSLSQAAALQEASDFDHGETLQQVMQTACNSSEYPDETEFKQQLLDEICWQLNSIPLFDTSLSAFNLVSGTFSRGVQQWGNLVEAYESDPEPSGSEVDDWMRRKQIIQTAVRRVILNRDVENLQRRRELEHQRPSRRPASLCSPTKRQVPSKCRRNREKRRHSKRHGGSASWSARDSLRGSGCQPSQSASRRQAGGL
ncbi:unnamed protein product, partial [Amoebophrya sp. A25]